MDVSRVEDATPRRPRLEDVAARVGMSPASVSMVLSNAPGPSAATRERVLEAAAELGYRPDRTASLLARRRTHLVGVQMVVGSAFHVDGSGHNTIRLSFSAPSLERIVEGSKRLAEAFA